MAWKGLHLSRPSRLSTADGQIVVAQDDGEARVALEDVAYVILDTPQATLTTTLLSACMEAGVAVVVTDARHMPSGLLLPFHAHHRQAGVAALQTTASEPFRKRCWQNIVVAKIDNQAAHLERRQGAEALRVAGDERRASAPATPTTSRRGRRGPTGARCSTVSFATIRPICATSCSTTATR